jgi:putative holliday junction resolvase
VSDPDASPASGRVLGLDLGDVRVGVAISDAERRMAVPFGTVHVGSPPGELRAIAALVEDNDVSLIVLGHPLLLSGKRGERATHAEEFAEALRAFVRVPVVLHDERLSSVEAERHLAEAGAARRARRRAVDQSAATVILQAFLDGSR